MNTLISRHQLLARAFAAFQAGNFGQAELFCKRLLECDRKQFDALHMLGVIAAQRGNFTLGLRRLKDALRVRPDSADVLINLGRIQSELGDNSAAIATYERALALAPQSTLAHVNIGIVLSRLGRSEEALVHCDAAANAAPSYAEAWNCRANILLDLGRMSDALESYDRALWLNPDFAEAHLGRGTALRQLNHHDAALAAYERAVAINPKLSEGWYGRGLIFFQLKRYEDAIAAYGTAIALSPDYAQGAQLAAKMQIGDWQNFEADRAALVAAVRHKGLKSDPFRMLAVSGSPADQLTCAKAAMADRWPPAEQSLCRGEIYRHDRVRVAYVSADFHEHATAYLAAGWFESHDRSRFETFALSFGPDTDDAMRQRLRTAFDHFLDVKELTANEIARRIRALEIDIAVDLKGYTTNARPTVFSLKPAPIQVCYLGYPGTSAARYMDYILADETVIPPDKAQFFTENIVWLPETYQANDRTRYIPSHQPRRPEVGLPDEGFVYCCFNNIFKITPSIFDVWMRLLQQVEGSVLWLFRENVSVEHNLRLEAKRRGVAPQRLVFAPHVPVDSHLARHQCADLVLDTLPYNAHTTASDALWSGVPVLTCLGTAFAGRVAASLLKAAGLAQLITTSLEEYETLALRIARQPDLLVSLKQELARNRLSCPLFDTQRFTRHTEAAYITMWTMYERGEAPRSFAVPPLG